MTLQETTTKSSTTYYVRKSFRTEEGKYSSKIVERLGTIKELEERFGSEDPIGAAKEYIKELTLAEKEANRTVSIQYNPTSFIKKGEQRTYNGGYLFLQKIYHDLRLHEICKSISKKHKIQFDLNEILSSLLYTRIIYPGSKLSSYEAAHNFFEQPKYDLHQIYRALSILAKESDAIQASVYKNSLKLGKRNTKVLYYDCTNYFFETEMVDGLRQYGHSKESRPNPIVQMGLFMDMDGFPLAFCINPGNTNEQITLKPLEQKLNDKFGISKMVVCTDSGLSSYENRKNNTVGGHAFITVQSLKKLKSHIQEWALDPKGWSTFSGENTFDLTELDPEECKNITFYKERWINENNLSQRIIVTFSFKYKAYLNALRNRQIDRATKILENGPAKRKKRANDPLRFVQETSCTEDGELAQITSYSLNEEMITQEEKFDGFYAICTDLEDPAMDILKANRGRWIIENGFRIMKTEFEARPVYLQRDERIEAHFLTCFLALLLYKYLESKVNVGLNHFTPSEIINTLNQMNFLAVPGDGYVPTYTRTDLTNALHGSAGFRTDKEIIAKKKMREIISATKNSRSSQRKMKESRK